MNNKNIITSLLLIGSLILTGCTNSNDLNNTMDKETKQEQAHIVRCAECKKEMKETEYDIYICTNPSCKEFDNQQQEETVKKESKEEDLYNVACTGCGKMTKSSDKDWSLCDDCWNEEDKARQEFFEEQEQKEQQCTNDDNCPIAHEHANKKCTHCNELDFPTNFLDDPTGNTCDTCYSQGKVCGMCGLWREYLYYRADDAPYCSDCLVKTYECNSCGKELGEDKGVFISSVEVYHTECYKRLEESMFNKPTYE